MNNKAQVQGAVGAMIALFIGVIVIVLLIILAGALGGQTFNLVQDDIIEVGNQSIVNESFTAINDTVVTLDHRLIHSGSLTILNDSADVGLGNFTIDYDGGDLTLLNNDYNNTALDASYNYGDLTVQGNIENSIKEGFSTLEDTAGYVPIVVLAIIIFLVLTLVIGFTALTGGTNRGGTAL